MLTVGPTQQQKNDFPVEANMRAKNANGKSLHQTLLIPDKCLKKNKTLFEYVFCPSVLSINELSWEFLFIAIIS